ncbi:hypothetical protein PLEOSDRAFT_1100770 [Pleurotus ostreatus PC15]|uniref:GPI-GlcNAc transferase complex PIG-H component conserved domain-containing protein n=1 Tax=Pleurotus ostreatus (strain PC15) TaxID=1137138 RepID=A0A067NZ54_PLEO1|nr:hypothetical protein PLEOSDRAFT_1100770 [Pleurotus ostreatus PC15]
MRAATVSRKFAANLLLFCASSETHLPCASVRLQTCLDSGIVAGSLTALYDPGLPPRGQSLPSFRCLALECPSTHPSAGQDQALHVLLPTHAPGLGAPFAEHISPSRPSSVHPEEDALCQMGGRPSSLGHRSESSGPTLNSSLLEGFSAVPGFHGVVKSHSVVESPSATLGGPCHTMHGLPCNVFLQVWAYVLIACISIGLLALASRLLLDQTAPVRVFDGSRRTIGGHLSRVIHYGELEDFVVNGPVVEDIDNLGLIFKGLYSDIEVLEYPPSIYLHVKADVAVILPLLTARECVSVAAKHGILCGKKCAKSLVIDMAQNHSCAICYSLTYVFEIRATKKFTTYFSRIPLQEKQHIETARTVKSKKADEPMDVEFPPLPGVCCSPPHVHLTFR